MTRTTKCVLILVGSVVVGSLVQQSIAQQGPRRPMQRQYQVIIDSDRTLGVAFEAAFIFAGDSKPVRFISKRTPFVFEATGEFAIGVVQTNSKTDEVKLSLLDKARGNILNPHGSCFMFVHFNPGSVGAAPAGFSFGRDFAPES